MSATETQFDCPVVLAQLALGHAGGQNLMFESHSHLTLQPNQVVRGHQERLGGFLKKCSQEFVGAIIFNFRGQGHFIGL